MRKILSLFFVGVLLASIFVGVLYIKERQDVRKKAQSVNSVQGKVLLLIYNPIIESHGGKRLAEVVGWNNPDQLTTSFLGSVSDISGGGANYTIVERVELDKFPKHVDGFQYTDESFLNCLAKRDKVACHKPGQEDGFGYLADYREMIAEVDACGKRNRDEITELWIWGGPYFGFWESNLAGPPSKVFYYNSGATTGTSCEKLLP
ncbi:MAG: hypothetical protein AAB599_01025, partial [Patescibacteria group bacterium]